jgi:3-hydroxyacyl-CoA dehydrogenase/enoyl-CoA hydratase/3-hydroxybutyryl-CoA epimerase
MEHASMTVDRSSWTLSRDGDGLAWLTFDRPDAAANTLSAATVDEFVAMLDLLERDAPRGLVIRSGKSNGFIAGADVGEFGAIHDAVAARALVERGWRAFERLAGVRYPAVALVRGFCLGGGLELALACRYRVVVDEPATRLGLPEVMLGIVPGWGGIKRLPALIGAPAALDLLLTGRTIDARRARKLGLADECVPPRIMANTARGVLLAASAPRRLGFPLSLTLTTPGRRFVADRAAKVVEKRASRAHYPAPYAILELFRRYDGNALAPPVGDPAAIDALLATPTAKNLIRVFGLQERLKSFGKADAAAVTRVHVIGAGAMGGDIAAWCALRGMTVTLQDQDAVRLAPAFTRAATLLKSRLRDKRRIRDASDRLIPDVAGDGIAHADLVIEAIFENVDAKRAVFAEVEKRARADAVLATNTSSIPLEDIASVLAAPQRLVGVHFFNPVARMMLVEIVAGRESDPAALARAAGFVRAIDRLPLPVKSAPGFLVNRVLAPYLMTAMRCVDEGIPAETVDRAAVAFGMPVGPIELADAVGLDICLAVGRMLAKGAAVPRTLAERVDAGRLGKKSGQGYYLWKDGKAQKGAAGVPDAGLTSRLIDPMVAEARAALAEGIVADADLVDAGAIFGTGFAPFRGGPLHYAANEDERAD